MAVNYKVTGVVGLDVERFADLDDALDFACRQFGIETLAVEDPEPRRDPSYPLSWQIYDEADMGAFSDREMYIVEVESK